MFNNATNFYDPKMNSVSKLETKHIIIGLEFALYLAGLLINFSLTINTMDFVVGGMSTTVMRLFFQICFNELTLTSC